MPLLSLSLHRVEQLHRFRRRTWVLIALCFFLRAADAAFGLNLIEHPETVTAPETPACVVFKENLS